MRVTFVEPSGAEKTVEAKAGDSLMQTALNNGVDGIVAECGGSMACATCHVYVDEDWTLKTGERRDGEEDMLDCAMSEMRGTSRLSCQIMLSDDLDGLRVHVAPEQT